MELNAVLKELKRVTGRYGDARGSPKKMNKWRDEMERLTQRKEELECRWGDATTRSSTKDWLKIDEVPEFDSLLRMRDGKPDLEIIKGGKKGKRGWQEAYAYKTFPYRKLTSRTIDDGRKRYNAARNAAQNAIRALDIVIPGLRVTWKNDTALGTYDDENNTIDIGLGEIAAATKSQKGAHNLAVQTIKHEFARAIWRRMDMETRREWMGVVRSIGPMSDDDRNRRDGAKDGIHFLGTCRFGKEADVRSDKELGWLFAAAESHSIVLEAVGADEEDYYNPNKNFDLDNNPGQIAKYRRNRNRLLKAYKRMFGHLGVAENFAKIS